MRTIIHTHHHLKIATLLAKLLDNQFQVFGFRFGLDPLLGLVPGIGGIITMALSFYIVWIAIGMKIPQDIIMQMVRNILIDFLIGIIPIVGDVGDFFFKANSKNLELLRRAMPPDIQEGEIVEER